jgi:alpha-N-arabinofuranosidase
VLPVDVEVLAQQVEEEPGAPHDDEDGTRREREAIRRELGLRTVFSAPAIEYSRDGKPAQFWGLKGSASLRGKTVVLTVVNPSVDDPREAEIALSGAKPRSGTITSLSNPDIHAYNSFQHRDAVVPQMSELKIAGPTLVVTFPPASVTALQIDLV